MNNDAFENLLNAVSVLLGYENLLENRQQSAENDVAKHNRQQTDLLLNNIHEEFERQNQMLEYQNDLLEQILKILKGDEK